MIQAPTFPDPATWLPNLDALNDVGEGLLAVALGALEVHGLRDRYDRTYVGHGTEAPVVRSRAKQLTVVCTKLYAGGAGEEQFQFTKGNPAAYAKQTAQFMVELSAPWPMPTRGGATPALTATTDLDEHRRTLWRDGLVVWAAMIALVLGGVTRPWQRAGTGDRGNEIAVGPLQPKEPGGGQASWVLQVQVEL